ncbi:MAG: hypothetical protein PHX83_11415 [Acidobacteriia bacterium]|nr:hypothetical protein [Terriglobia bacterium]
MRVQTLYSGLLLTFALGFGVSHLASNTAKQEPNKRPVARNRVATAAPRHPLWPGSRFTEEDRDRAVHRALRFIYHTARNPRNFSDHGHDYLWCFYTTAEAMKDEKLRRTAWRMGVELARRWRARHPSVPRNADVDTVELLAFGNQTVGELGFADARIKKEIALAAARFTARDYLNFDPITEPPPSDVPAVCPKCGAYNSRGVTVCTVCKTPLEMMSRYGVWYEALIATWSGDLYGVKLGAHYADVLKWLPRMRPYRGREDGNNSDFYDSVFAVAHVVYTLNDYSIYKLSPALLPQEFRFLKSSVKDAIATDDSEMLGEILDSLKSFGMTNDDPEIRAGMEYLLSHQNPDGSWGDPTEKDIYARYHPTWTAMDGLSEYAWRGEGLSFPELKPWLEKWAR